MATDGFAEKELSSILNKDRALLRRTPPVSLGLGGSHHAGERSRVLANVRSFLKQL
jgi:hypothetical protein